jgi:adenylate cyclase
VRLKSLKAMDHASKEARRLTSVELLDAAIWREIGSREPQPSAAFVEALSALLGRWLLVRSAAPEMDAVTVLCKARGYISRYYEAVQTQEIEWTR